MDPLGWLSLGGCMSPAKAPVVNVRRVPKVREQSEFYYITGGNGSHPISGENGMGALTQALPPAIPALPSIGLPPIPPTFAPPKSAPATIVQKNNLGVGLGAGAAIGILIGLMFASKVFKESKKDPNAPKALATA